MKKSFAILLAAALLLSLCACKAAEQTPQTATSATLPTVLDTMEYTLYQNIFYNDMGGDYVGQRITKTGTFTTLQDSFNGVTRYYVWGYNDQTKCCDWQWEFVPKDVSALPANGSFVQMTGTFAADEAALDGYWFLDAEVQTQTVYQGPDCDIDMGTMSATLERVQLINMQYYPQDYAGKSVRLYGRVAGLDSVEHPYYDGAWQQSFSTTGEVPAIGKLVTVTGIFRDGVVTDAAVVLTDAY